MTSIKFPNTTAFIEILFVKSSADVISYFPLGYFRYLTKKPEDSSGIAGIHALAVREHSHYAAVLFSKTLGTFTTKHFHGRHSPPRRQRIAQAQDLHISYCSREAIRIFTFEAKEIVMNWDTVAGNWTQFKGKVKEQWGKLTDDELDVIGGKRDQLIGKIQEAYGISRDEAERQIEGFERTLH